MVRILLPDLNTLLKPRSRFAEMHSLSRRRGFMIGKRLIGLGKRRIGFGLARNVIRRYVLRGFESFMACPTLPLGYGKTS
jgi:hypothetical protein